MATNSYADCIQHWGQLDDRVRVNPELAPFEPLREQLEAERLGLVTGMNQQSALKAQTQEVSRSIEGHAKRGRAVATRLRDAIRAVYGRDDEKLTEFGLNVRRLRSTTDTGTTPELKKKPPETGPTPAQPAASETDGTI